MLAAVDPCRERLHHAGDDVVDRIDRLARTVDAFALCESDDRRNDGEARPFIVVQQLTDTVFRPLGRDPRMDRANRRALPPVGSLGIGDVAIHFQLSIDSKLSPQNPRQI